MAGRNLLRSAMMMMMKVLCVVDEKDFPRSLAAKLSSSTFGGKNLLSFRARTQVCLRWHRAPNSLDRCLRHLSGKKNAIAKLS
eukprot:scaffold281_cov129-Skeletonema_dohrnii-CCMP3373.AAC.1